MIPSDKNDWYGDLRPILDDDLASFVREKDRHRSMTVVRDEDDRDIIGETRRWLDKLNADAGTTGTCARMSRAIERWAAEASRDGQLRGVLAMVRLDERGHRGLAVALDDLLSVRAKDPHDFNRLVEWARHQVLARPSSPGDIGCHCDPPSPTPLKPPRVPVAFPTQALPAWAGEWVRAEATATQTPDDLAGTCVLCVMAACCGGRVQVQPRPGWREPLNLYGLPVMPPGSRKSAVIAAATQALYQAEADMVAAVKADQAGAIFLRDIARKAAKVAIDRAANGKGDDRQKRTDEALKAQQAAEEIVVPVTPRMMADDVTPEAVGSLLAEHDGRLAIISAEGGVFDIMGGRYSLGVPSLDVWLKGHSGDPLRVDRKGRPSEYVPSPALTLLLTVQPEVLARIARNGVFRGRGLTARFLYALPLDNVGHRQVGAATVPDEVAATYEKRVRGLAAEFAGWTDPAILQLTDAARARLLRLERAVEPRLRRDGEYGPIREWASKLVGAILRIAGLLHLAEDGERFRQPINAETLDRAILLGAYYVDHAQAAFDLLGDGGVSDATYVLDFLRRRELQQFTIRSLLTDLPRGRFASRDEVTAAVNVLVEHGWVKPLPPPERSGPGRQPSPGYRVHVNVSAESAQSAEFGQTAGETRPAVSLIGSAETAESADSNSADCADIADTFTDAGTPPDDGQVCARCGDESPDPLVLGHCRRCAYPAGGGPDDDEDAE